MFKGSLIFFFAFAAVSTVAQEISSLSTPELAPQEKRISHSFEPNSVRGWSHLAKRFVESGISHEETLRIFSDKRLAQWSGLQFSLNPKESHYNYRKLNTKRNRQNALSFYRTHHRYFIEAEQRFSVPQSVILAILQVETACGKNTGRSSVFSGLARLANAADPENIESNVRRFATEKKKISDRDLAVLRVKVEHRAKWLEQTFLPHAVAAVRLAKELNVDLYALQGSPSGALGLPQFLPGNLYLHGVDGNGDGKVDLYDPSDAILSVAKFLNSHGWNQNKLPTKKKREVIWEYNRSTPYIDTVLTMADHLAVEQKKSANKKGSS